MLAVHAPARRPRLLSPVVIVIMAESDICAFRRERPDDRCADSPTAAGGESGTVLKLACSGHRLAFHIQECGFLAARLEACFWHGRLPNKPREPWLEGGRVRLRGRRFHCALFQVQPRNLRGAAAASDIPNTRSYVA
jgi:hypothetical protein